MFPFPNPSLKPGSSLADAFITRGLGSFHDVVLWVWKLPYGRNSDRSDFSLVIKEGRGTCSTKHALLGQLANDLGIDLQLMIGIFLMNEENTREVAEILRRYTLREIPEAHCFLKCRESRFDFTMYKDGKPPLASHEFVYQEAIQPPQIGEYKMRLHQEWIRRWMTTRVLAKPVAFEALWQAREQCLQLFEQHTYGI